MPKRPTQKESTRAKYWIGALVSILVVGASYGIYSIMQPKHEKPPVAASYQVFPQQPATHISEGAEHPPYNSLPPTSGWHYARWAPWGISEAPIPDELQVHNLEHGGVLIQYHPDLSTEEVAQLKEIARNLERRYCKILMAPYPKLDKRVALTAWQRLDKFDTVDQARIEAFAREFVNKGPERVPC
jgi:hypothetical protein